MVKTEVILLVSRSQTMHKWVLVTSACEYSCSSTCGTVSKRPMCCYHTPLMLLMLSSALVNNMVLYIMLLAALRVPRTHLWWLLNVKLK